MRLETWLDAKAGRATALAAHFKVTRAAVSQWRDNGVPRDKMLAVRAYTRGAVKLEDMFERPKASQQA